MEEYPDSWDDYIGQDQVKTLLRCAAESARRRSEPMDHVLIACPTGGVGKTALAHLVAHEIGSTLFKVAEAMETGAARHIIDTMHDFDVLFIDEIHRFKRVTWLHHLLQDGLITGRTGQLIPAPRITVIGATTAPHKLDETILGRFQYTPTLRELTDVEALRVAQSMAKQIFLDVQLPLNGCLNGLASAANNNPRVIKQLLRTVRDLALTDHSRWVEGYGWDLGPTLELRGLYLDGLTDQGMDYLQTLESLGGQAGHNWIAGVLGERAGLATVERLLLSKGYIERDRGGRILTRTGRERILEEEGTAA